MPIEARTVFCDDIRREDNGKMILIGVYADDLIPGAMPSAFPLSLWISIKGERIGSDRLTVTLSQPGGNQLKLNGQIGEVPEDASASLIFSGLPIEIKEPGLIAVTLALGDNDPIDAGSLLVRPSRAFNFGPATAQS